MLPYSPLRLASCVSDGFWKNFPRFLRGGGSPLLRLILCFSLASGEVCTVVVSVAALFVRNAV